MKKSLEIYLRNKLNEVESMGYFELATDTIRCWIDEYNEQLRISYLNKESITQNRKK